MKPECCGTGTPSGRAACGSRPPPGSTASSETFMLAPSTSNSSISTEVLGGTYSLSKVLRARWYGFTHSARG